MLLPESDGVVWFCAFQYDDLPLPPAQETEPQDSHPDICSSWLNTFAPAGGVGNAEELADAEATEAGVAVVVAVDVEPGVVAVVVSVDAEPGAVAVFGVEAPAEVVVVVPDVGVAAAVEVGLLLACPPQPMVASVRQSSTTVPSVIQDVFSKA